ncbi:MAG TPA: YkgJ family cysteine cluster protein [Thermodesulfobacteriaceae bacterium]|nr:YkgJ family cysteine cluster protein [Thermodesulfobacteriaceae bacterium]
MTEKPETHLDDSRQLKDEDSFCFSCYPDRECFTACCHDLNLVLMPYDILRMKRRLGMKSGDFLKKYTSVHVGPESGFPIVMLRMEGPYLSCPFLDREKGCTVYEDRPGACRTYPLARMARRTRESTDVEEFFCLVREPGCEGFKDGREWTVRSWKDHEGLDVYNEMNDIFGELLQARNETGIKQLDADQIDTFYMGCYDLDEFRQFFLNGPNLERFMESEETIARISDDDEELLKYALRWVKKKLFQGGLLSCGVGCGT